MLLNRQPHPDPKHNYELRDSREFRRTSDRGDQQTTQTILALTLTRPYEASFPLKWNVQFYHL